MSDYVDYSLSIGRVAVPDERYDHLCESFKPASRVPAFLHVVDIAGLVRGAHEGKVLKVNCLIVVTTSY